MPNSNYQNDMGYYLYLRHREDMYGTEESCEKDEGEEGSESCDGAGAIYPRACLKTED